MRKKYQILMAKTGRGTEEAWLPLWMHLRDTVGVMKKLVPKWVPKSVFSAAEMEYESFLSAAVFLAATHDIGKATSCFQSVITRDCVDKYADIADSGFVLKKSYRAAGKTPHAHAGQWILQSDVTGFGVHESLAMAVGAHHGKPIGADSVMGESDLVRLYPMNYFGTEKKDETKALWKEAWKDIVDEALTLAGVQSVTELPVLTLEAQVLLSGLLIVADWIASNTAFFPLISLEECGDEHVYPERIKSGWERAAFPEGWHSEVARMDKKGFKERFGFLPNEPQNSMMEAVNNAKDPGIFILEAQMGIGKTEAALGAAEILACKREAGGIFYGLPTQATSNGLFGRLYQWGEKVSQETVNAIRLAHSSAEFHEEYHQLMMKGRAYVDDDGQDRGGLEVNPWFQGNKRALLADFVIGTVDQFLMASLRRKHFMLRHIGLAGKVVIIDECHAYDAYMNQYLERSLQWLAAYHVPVILLSATLPFDRRKALVECYVKAYARYHLKKKKPEITYRCPDWEKNTGYPLITWTDGETVEQMTIEQNIPDKIVRIQWADSMVDMVRLLDDRLEEGGCACVIVNTVKMAQKIYEECKRAMEDVNLVLYHAQFTTPDRYKKEQALLKKMGKASHDRDRYRFILIGTQVLEQSLDYDADLMVTQLCTMDLLLQRIGRLHRHSKRDEGEQDYTRPPGLRDPQCVILREDGQAYDEGSKAVYGEYLLMRTEQILPGEIKIPGDITALVQKVYDKDDDLGLSGQLYMDARNQHKERRKGKKQEAKSYLLEKPSSKTIQAILDNLEGSSEKTAEAAVRDGVSSIEVLLMKMGEEGKVLFPGESGDKSIGLSVMETPDSVQGRKVAMERLKLPHVFGAVWNRDKTIRELEEINRRQLPQWQMSPWLQGELILMLDSDGCGELNGYTLQYTFEKGLEYERKEEKDGGEGV